MEYNKQSLLNIILLCSIAFPMIVSAQGSIIPFDSDRWQIFSGRVAEHLGRQSLSGSAMLKDVEFDNGIIEFDMAVTGERSYPGIRFRAQSRANAENIYIRPHIIGMSPDALQYTPVFNNEACWQLYNGDGYTSGIQIPLNEWVHFKLVVFGSQARVYIGNTEKPTLKIDYLKHGKSTGGIALTAPPNGSAHFSNFSINETYTEIFEPPLVMETPPGTIDDWEISQPLKYSQIDLEKTPRQQGLQINWQAVEPEPNGLVNVSRYIQRQGREPDFVFARTIIEVDEPERKEIKFGYSDWIVIFLNSELIFWGSSPYRGRDPSFLGIVGLFDAVSLSLKPGKNELMLLVGESFGGWGFMCRDGKAIYHDQTLSKQWESEQVFKTSESVIYDPKRDVLYVTNFDQFNVGNPRIQQFISKVSLDGKIEALKWVDSLNNPLGMTIYNDKLYTAERNAVAEIDLDLGQIIRRYHIPGSAFLNDIAIDKQGRIYISDSRKNVIWRFAENQAEEWLSGTAVSDPNVLYYDDGKIVWGNSADRCLKSVDTESKEIKVIARFPKGFIDGLRIDNQGNYLVSLWEGMLFRVTPDGKVTKLLDTTAPDTYSADFEYIGDKNMLVIPTFLNNTIVAYRLN